MNQYHSIYLPQFTMGEDAFGTFPRRHPRFGESDLGWVELALCMRGAGLPVEAMIEYVKLCQQGDSTIEARMLLLKEQMETLLEQKAQIESTIKRLDFKISRYEEAVKTGKLTWE